MCVTKPLSLVVDGVEIGDPSPWLEMAHEKGANSPCHVRWMSFNMAQAQEPERAEGMYCHTDAGYAVRVLHFEGAGHLVEVPMVTHAEQALIQDISHLCAMNLSRLASIEFWAVQDDVAERQGRASVFTKLAA